MENPNPIEYKMPATVACALLSATPSKPERATVAYLKERVRALAVRSVIAFYGGNATGWKPTIAELLELATAALDVAHDHVASDESATESDMQRIENTRRTVIDVLHGCPAAGLSKRDAFYTLGALVDAGLITSFAELLTPDVLDAATRACVEYAAPAQVR